MAVFTDVSVDEANALARKLGLGDVTALEGCKGGIENTNYFLDTAKGRYVLTVFERLRFEQLPFSLALMKHLAARGVPVPDPAEDAEGVYLHSLHGKPAAIVNRLPGASALAPDAAHCAVVGAMLARMHLAGADFTIDQRNLRGLPWWNDTAQLVLPHLDADQAALLRSELAYQNHVAASATSIGLPRGAIHADLFRDNVLFVPRHDQEGAQQTPTLGGIFDFYFAGVDSWLFDIAVALNDWGVDLASGRCDPERSKAFLSAYCSVRQLSAAERSLMPAMLRAGALRFWISRLWDFHLPREASMLNPHDPGHFERVLRQRIASNAEFALNP
ncbi:MAG: homoserine kinase [Burkholderiaceae bacterium]